MRPRPGGHLWRSVSDDRGYTWSEAEETAIPNPNAGFDLLRTDSGRLLLIVNPVVADIPEGRNELAIFASEDDGETWPYQWYLEREEIDRPLADQPEVGRPEFSYGNLEQAPDGTIHVTYEFRRMGFKHLEVSEAEILDRGAGGSIVPEIAGNR